MGFQKSVELAFDEVNGRKNLRDGVLSFGMKYLDDAMIGILKNDLILIGAASGGGKTAFCCNLARVNVEKGKKVHYIALEAEPMEIERRIKYQIFGKFFFNDPKRPDVNMSFQNWMVGDFLTNCVQYEAQAASEFLRKYENLFTFYKTDKFDVDDLIKTVVEASTDTDLIILDHVHYMDYDGDNENKAIKQIAKTARSLALEMAKPIILVSHVRKSDKSSNGFAPSMEDFHGSSDLYKIATKAITLGPGSVTSDGKIETYVRIVKNRFEGSVTRYLGKCLFNGKAGIYEKRYEIGDSFQNRDSEFKQIAYLHYPKWAEYYAAEIRNPLSDVQGQSKVYANAGRKKNLST